jgi:HEAT repeat protein
MGEPGRSVVSGSDAGPELAQLVAAGDLRRVAQAAGYRRRWGTWRATGTDRAPGTRMEAIRALARLAPAHLDDVLAMLVLSAADGDHRVRAASVTCLEEAIRAARGARSSPSPSDAQLAAAETASLEALRDPNDQVRTTAAGTLRTFDAGRGVWSALLGALEDPCPEVRVAAALTLGGRTDAAATDSIDALVAVGNAAAVLALGKIRSSMHVRGHQRDYIDEGLRTLATEVPDAYLALIDQLRGNTSVGWNLRRGLIEVLGDPRCASLVPALARRLVDRTDPAFRELLHALLATGVAEVVPVLIEVLADTSLAVDVRLYALDEAERRGVQIPLGALDRAGRIAVDHVTRTLAQRSDPVPALLAMATRGAAEPEARVAAIEALAATGDRRAVEPLVELLIEDATLGPAVLGYDHPDDQGRWDAAFDDPQADAAQQLLRWAPRSATSVRVAAGTALAPFLDEAAPDRVRLAVWLALRRSEELSRWLEQARSTSPTAAAELDRFVYDRLDWLDVETAIPVAVALANAGSEPARALIGSLTSLAREMTRETDREAEQTFMGDQTIQKRTMTVSMETTRRRGRHYLDLLGVEP